MSQRVVVTEKQFDEFKEVCEAWLEKLGLHEWDVVYEFADLGDDISLCKSNHAAKKACLSLNTTIQVVHCQAGWVEKAALHEVLELMLDDFDVFFMDATAYGVLEMRHKMIHRLSRVLLEK